MLPKASSGCVQKPPQSSSAQSGLYQASLTIPDATRGHTWHAASSLGLATTRSPQGCSILPAQPALPVPQQPWQRRRLVCRAGGSPGIPENDPYMNLFQSPIFRNSSTVQEFNSMVNDLMALSQMASKFPDFDTAGKRMYLDKMAEASERYEIFIKRLELSDDPAAREFLRVTNAQMLNGGFTLRGMFEGLKGSLSQYQMFVTQEEAALAAGPVAHQEYLKAFRSVWQQSALGVINTSQLAQNLPPEVLMAAQRDPQFWTAIREISDNPTTETMNKWMSNPNLAPLVAEMAKVALQQQMSRQQQQQQ